MSDKPIPVISERSLMNNENNKAEKIYFAVSPTSQKGRSTQFYQHWLLSDYSTRLKKKLQTKLKICSVYQKSFCDHKVKSFFNIELCKWNICARSDAGKIVPINHCCICAELIWTVHQRICPGVVQELKTHKVRC